jgi:hypothetical protein
MLRSRFPVCALVLLTLLSVVPTASAGDFSAEARRGIVEILERLWQTIAGLVAPPMNTTASACGDSGSIMDPNGCPRG